MPMDDIYENLRKVGKNNVDTLVQWLKDSNIIDDEKSAEEQARKMFSKCTDHCNVKVEQFKQVINDLSIQQKREPEDVTARLLAKADKVANALGEAAEAFAKAMHK